MAERAPTELAAATATTDTTRLPPEALYLHVPFCVSHCPYCDFVVYAGAAARGPAARVEAFVAALLAELRLRADRLERDFGPSRPPLRSIYLGGGTPSLLPAASVASILETIRGRYVLAPGAEVTLEANPSPDERADLAGFADAGVNRVSFGAQSMDPGELRRLGRRHSPEDVATAVQAARVAGFGDVSLDLLYDVPGQTVESWRRTLEAALDLAPDHLSLYALTLDDPDEEGITGPLGDHLPTSRGARRWRETARVEQDDDRAAEQYTVASERLAAAGCRGYEISNWARPDHESRHNLVYWTRRPYEAVGPGGHAFDGVTRRWNAARLDTYVAALAGPEPVLPPGGHETLTTADADAEAAILALRLDTGVAADLVASPRFAGAFDWALREGLVEHADVDGAARVRLTLRGRLLSNELFSRLV